MFGGEKHSKIKPGGHHEGKVEYRDKKRRLFETGPHVPSHKALELPDKSDGLAWAADLDGNMWAFSYFRDFPNYVHKLIEPNEYSDDGPWCLEQMSDPYLRSFGLNDGPVIGLRYKLFYNSEVTGDVEIMPWDSRFSDLPEGYREVSLHINVSEAPFIPYDHLTGLLLVCSEPFDRPPGGSDKHGRIAAIGRAIDRVLWESNRLDSLWVPLDFEFTGTINEGLPVK